MMLLEIMMLMLITFHITLNKLKILEIMFNYIVKLDQLSIKKIYIMLKYV